MNDAIPLKNGEQLVIHILEPPLGDYADQVGCWGDVRDDLLGGVFRPWLFTPYFVGEIDGEVVGSMSYYAPTDRREVGVVEFVQTRKAHRKKGISSQLMARLIERFLGDQGKALYLCTTNPVAGHLYENYGFWYHVGDGMRYLAPDAQDFDRIYWTFCGKGKIRAATWGDLPRLSALYNHPGPRWLLKDYLTQTFGEMRYESHFVKLMRRIENDRGAFLVLENPEKRVVGAAAFERCGTFFEQHIATLGFRICPAYEEQAAELLEAAVEAAGSLGVRTLQVPIAARDEDQIALVISAGFSEAARLTDRLRVGEKWMDMLIYSRNVGDTVLPFREEGDYYGARKSWQVERVQKREEEV